MASRPLSSGGQNATQTRAPSVEPLIMSLPTEILEKILTQVMRSKTPVHLRQLIERDCLYDGDKTYKELKEKEHARQGKSREARATIHQCQDLLGDVGKRLIIQLTDSLATSDLLSSSSGPSNPSNPRRPKVYVLAELNHGQIEHYEDWLVTKTCQRFEEIGKQLFFAEKTFVIESAFLEAIMEGRVKGMSTADVALARGAIQAILVPIPTKGSAVPWMKLSRYSCFPSLDKMSIEPEKDFCWSDQVDAALDARKKWVTPVPEELAGLLRWLNVDLERWNVELVSANNQKAKDKMLNSLPDKVYPILRILVNQKKAKASKLAGTAT